MSNFRTASQRMPPHLFQLSRRPPKSTLFPYTTLFRSTETTVDLAARRRTEALCVAGAPCVSGRSEEHTSELQSLRHLVCRLLLEKKKKMLKETSLGYLTLQQIELKKRT